jgi:hypothetical protein
MSYDHVVTAQVTLTGGDVNKMGGVFTGSTVRALTRVPSDYSCSTSTTALPSCARFNVVPGTVYSIQVVGEDRQADSMTIAVTQTVVPSNDLFSSVAAKLPATGTTLSGTGTTQGAKLEPGEPLAGTGASGSVWYRFAAPASARNATVSGCILLL